MGLAASSCHQATLHYYPPKVGQPSVSILALVASVRPLRKISEACPYSLCKVFLLGIVLGLALLMVSVWRSRPMDQFCSVGWGFGHSGPLPGLRLLQLPDKAGVRP